ncbi:hypothetical protein [Leucobacter sp. G161]|uniref:hypothetical protein n=1 Tax=Leucobacter sp. G161 TaxID=663704 RepID=UPI000A95A9D1|nr:hypothetical protein [Leucobacter sp. G161]
MFDDFKVVNYPKSLPSPEAYARHMSRMFTGDIIDGFTVTPGTGLQVVLAPGNAMIRYGSAAVASARMVSLVNNFSLAIDVADVSNPRIDLVVIYVDNAVDLPGGTPTAANLDGKGVAKAKVVKGTAAAVPAKPNATAIQASVGAGNPYSVVAEVRVDAGVSVIAANKISDSRKLTVLQGDKIDLGVITGGLTLNQTTGWNNADTIDVSSFPDGAKLDVFVTAYIEATTSELRGVRIIGDVNPSLNTVDAGKLASFTTSRIVTKSSPTIAVQTIGSWVDATSKSCGYIVKRVG